MKGLRIFDLLKEGEYIRFPESACVLYLTFDKRLLLVRQFRAIVGHFTLELPGGKVEDGELPEAAAKRELHEETGCQCDVLTHLFSLDMDLSSSFHRTHVFVSTEGRALGASLKGEFELLQITVAEALQRVLKQEISHAPTVAAILWAANQRS